MSVFQGVCFSVFLWYPLSSICLFFSFSRYLFFLRFVCFFIFLRYLFFLLFVCLFAQGTFPHHSSSIHLNKRPDADTTDACSQITPFYYCLLTCTYIFHTTHISHRSQYSHITLLSAHRSHPSTPADTDTDTTHISHRSQNSQITLLMLAHRSHPSTTVCSHYSHFSQITVLTYHTTVCSQITPFYSC